MRSTDGGRAVRRCALAAALAGAMAMSLPARGQEDDDASMIAAARRSVPEGGEDRTLAPYFFVWGGNDGTDVMPLKSSSALVDVTGVIANVQLEQVYRNDGESVLEAVYLFPASTRAAVHGMRMTVGERVIEARIGRREEARRRYEKARQEGRTASLLEQQRPNVFEMSVANILPGDEITVELSYSEILVPEERGYELVLPTVVGPRYSNVPAEGAARDESWVEGPYLHEGRPPTIECDIDVHLSSPIPIAEARSPSHQILVEHEGPGEANVSLSDPEGAGDRDCVRRYSLAGDRVLTGAITYDDGKDRYFLMMIEPPKRTEPGDVVRREYLFVLDVSGSMAGFPLDVSGTLVKDILGELGPGEYFNILTFAGGSDVYAEEPVEATPGAVASAVSWIDGLRGGGGTELLPALQRAFALERREGVSRTVIVATDGYVTVEREAFDVVARQLGEANLFAFGIGSSVNRELIEGLARAGQGEPFVVLDRDEAPEQADRFRRYVTAPLLTDISVKARGVEVRDLEPARLPDLFADRPIVMTGKLEGDGDGELVVTGRTADGPWTGRAAIRTRGDGAEDRALRHLWARKRIARLSDREAIGKGARKEITALGLEHGLMTAYTSFVAVDTVVRANGKKSRKVRQPIPLPKGVPDSAVGGGPSGKRAGQAIGTSFGYGGLAVSGTGHGGGGTGYGTIGLGNLSTIGRGAGGGGGAGFGRGSGRAGSAPPSMKMGSAVVRGHLSKEVIRRVIRSRINEIRSCYERALQAEPGLEGRVVVRFVIDASGKVTNATVQESTFDDDVIEKCILAAIERLTFPVAEGGGVNVVSYPFILKPTP